LGASEAAAPPPLWDSLSKTITITLNSSPPALVTNSPPALVTNSPLVLVTRLSWDIHPVFKDAPRPNRYGHRTKPYLSNFLTRLFSNGSTGVLLVLILRRPC